MDQAVATTSEPVIARPPQTHVAALDVSRYDQVSGILVSVLVVMGVATGALFVIWYTSLPVRVPTAVPVKVLEDVGGGGFGDSMSPGMEREFAEPSPEEMPTEQTTEPSPTESLEAVSAIVSSEAPALDFLEVTSGGQGRGEGTGMGDGRGKGPGGPGTSDGVPAWERWEVRMSAEKLDDYAKQLDFFGVELGVAGGGNPNVNYISKFTSSPPTVRVGSPKDEKRLRFNHSSGKLREADKELAAKAGVNTAGRVVFQFYSPQMYTNLLTLENIRMGTRRIREVRKTIFGVRAIGPRYEFFVISQEYIN